MQIIGGIHRSRRLIAPKGLQTRPTSSQLREALFNICQSYIQDARFLDLFAGSGAMGIEALSRGARHVTFVDNHREAIQCIRTNLENLELTKQATVLSGNVFTLIERLQKQGQQFEVIYADPPYETTGIFAGEEQNYSEQLLRLIDNSTLLTEKGMLFIEEANDISMTPFPLQTLQHVNTRRMGRSTLQQYRKV